MAEHSAGSTRPEPIGVVDAIPARKSEWMRVMALIPGLACPGALPRLTVFKSSRRPRCWASVAGNMRPASATRRSSSKCTDSRSRLWDDRIEKVLLPGVSMVSSQPPFSQVRAPFC